MSVRDSGSPLGEFLAARRQLVQPQDVGLPTLGSRRVPGLRREELATLAGISLNYYVRLERGQDRHPSASVVDAIAAALRLDVRTAAHLHELAGPSMPVAPADEVVRRGVLALLEAWTEQPAFVLGRHMDVLAANPLAAALHPGFRAGVNLMRFIFEEPESRDRYADWDAIAASSVAALRASVGGDVDDAALTELVADLTASSAAFTELWARHEIHDKDSGRKGFRHPEVGLITLGFESFAVTGSPGQQLVVYHAEAGSPDAELLAELATGLGAGAITAS